MTIIPVPFGPDSGPSRSKNASAGGLVNCFVEAAPDAKTPYAIYSTPGLKLFSDLSNSQGCRGGKVVNESLFYVVFGETLYKINSGGGKTAIGTIFGTDTVSMAYNKASPVEVAIVAGGKRYLMVSDVITEIADADLPQNPISVVYTDGYFVFFYTNGKMYQSAINDGSAYSALDFAEAEARQDKTRAGGILSDRPVNFGAESIEFFYNSAPAEGFSFSPQPGAQINRGILAANCWAEFDNTLTWLDQNGIAVRSEGTIAKVIGTAPVHKDIQATIKKQEQSKIVVCTWYLSGHEVLMIWSPDWCWCYDASTGKWFQRLSQDRDTWGGKHFFRVFNKTLVGDEASGILYEQDDATYNENGKQLICSLTSNYVHAGPNRTRHNAFFLDVETGVGNAEDTDAEDVTPECILSWSDDGGHTFTGGRQMSVGAQGEYGHRIRANRLGMSKDKGRVYRVEFSAARPFTFIAAYADVDQVNA